MGQTFVLHQVPSLEMELELLCHVREERAREESITAASMETQRGMVQNSRPEMLADLARLTVHPEILHIIALKAEHGSDVLFEVVSNKKVGDRTLDEVRRVAAEKRESSLITSPPQSRSYGVVLARADALVATRRSALK